MPVKIDYYRLDVKWEKNLFMESSTIGTLHSQTSDEFLLVTIR